MPKDYSTKRSQRRAVPAGYCGRCGKRVPSGLPFCSRGCKRAQERENKAKDR